MKNMPKPRILIVEDELEHLDAMRAKLEREGYEVLSAVNGNEGWRVMRVQKPDLVLLDVQLPGMSGFQILEEARKLKLKIPVIVVSNSGQPVEIDRVMELGAVDYLVKAEFSPTDVLAKIEKVLGASPKSRDNSVLGGEPAKNILVVEDDKFLRDILVQKLRREGFRVLEAPDGEEALKLAGSGHPDLILLDILLPRIDGFEVLKRLKADAATDSVPVIILSNLGQKEDITRALELGAEEFMVKAQFTPVQIIAKIKAVLKKRYL